MFKFLCKLLFEDLVKTAYTYVHTVLHKLPNNRQIKLFKSWRSL